jgi:hypothetical protein
MGLNKDIKTTYNFVDENGMMMTQNSSWNPEGDHGKGDSIGRTVDAFFAYEDDCFVKGVMDCYYVHYDSEGLYMQGYRHPSLTGDLSLYNTMSRDHIVNTLILYKEVELHYKLDEMSHYLRWKISDRYSFTIDLWLWMKGICGNTLAMTAYYLLQVPMMAVSALWNRLVFLWYRLPREVPQKDYILHKMEDIPTRVKKGRKLLYPVYTLYQVAFMLYVSNDSLGKLLLKRICLSMVDKENYLLRLMFGGKVTKEQVDSYQPMNGWRWSTYLSDLNDRDQHFITDPDSLKYNALDKDLLIKMFNIIN